MFRDFNFLGEDNLIFTMDITSRRSFSPQTFFDLCTVKEPSSETLLRLAELVLTLNWQLFTGSYYKQINGVAIGTKNGTQLRQSFRRLP